MPIAASRGTAIPVAPGDRPAVLTPYVAQKQSNWCWAACFEMIRNCLHLPSLSQCQMATAYFGGNCSQNPKSCNRAAFPDEADSDCGLRCTATGVLPLDEITAEIDLGRPVELQIDKQGDSGHVVLVVGYSGDMLEIHDPLDGIGQKTVSYAVLQTGYDGGTWKRSYYRFAALPPVDGADA